VVQYIAMLLVLAIPTQEYVPEKIRVVWLKYLDIAKQGILHAYVINWNAASILEAASYACIVTVHVD